MSLHTAEHIEVWQRAVIDGRRRVADLERRATYPAHPDEDTVALAEHYRLKYWHARILKALSYFTNVTPAELSAVTDIHPALLTMEVRRVAERVGVKVETVRKKDNTVVCYRLTDAEDRDEIRGVIALSWQF